MTATPASIRTFVITGALGGLGQAVARRLARDGHRLVLTDREDCSAWIAAESLGAAVAFTRRCELAETQDVARFISETLDHTRVDGLVNNAAYQFVRSVDDLTVDEMRLCNRINVEAPFQLTKGFMPGMRERGWGRVVNIVSGSAWTPSPHFTAYITSKMALVGQTRALAAELGVHGITVNGITPGLTRHAANANALPEALWDAVVQRQAIKRPARPEDLVGAVSFLMSEDAAFVTGQTLFADGGLIMN